MKCNIKTLTKKSKEKLAMRLFIETSKNLLNLYRYTDFNEEFNTFEDFVTALESIDYKILVERSKVKYDYS